MTFLRQTPFIPGNSIIIIIVEIHPNRYTTFRHFVCSFFGLSFFFSFSLFIFAWFATFFLFHSLFVTFFPCARRKLLLLPLQPRLPRSHSMPATFHSICKFIWAMMCVWGWQLCSCAVYRSVYMILILYFGPRFCQKPKAIVLGECECVRVELNRKSHGLCTIHWKRTRHERNAETQRKICVKILFFYFDK